MSVSCPDVCHCERETLLAIGQGETRQKSPSAWSYPNPTVKTHVGRVLAKIGARDRIQAVILTNDLGLTHPTGTG